MQLTSAREHGAECEHHLFLESQTQVSPFAPPKNQLKSISKVKNLQKKILIRKRRIAKKEKLKSMYKKKIMKKIKNVFGM